MQAIINILFMFVHIANTDYAKKIMPLKIKLALFFDREKMTFSFPSSFLLFFDTKEI